MIKRRTCFLWHNQYFQLDVYCQPCNERYLISGGFFGAGLISINCPTYIGRRGVFSDLKCFLLDIFSITHAGFL
jgi:hypothetical protein